jgi:hypothetical protein
MLNARINNIDCIVYYEERISQEKAPLGYPYMYHIRHDEDDWTRPVTLESLVAVNFFGTAFFKEPLEFGGTSYIEIERFSMERQFVQLKLSDAVFKNMFCLY